MTVVSLLLLLLLQLILRCWLYLLAAPESDFTSTSLQIISRVPVTTMTLNADSINSYTQRWRSPTNDGFLMFGHAYIANCREKNWHRLFPKACYIWQTDTTTTTRWLICKKWRMGTLTFPSFLSFFRFPSFLSFLFLSFSFLSSSFSLSSFLLPPLPL